jgi:membrane-associated protease RseP (regulator of RpoE activity)
MFSVLLIAVAAFLTSVLHVLVMAFIATSFGIVLREVSFGVGPRLWSFGLVQIRALPLGGSIKMKDAREEELSVRESWGAFDQMPTWKQFLLPLSGPLIILGLALLILRNEGVQALFSAFAQMWMGALNPTTLAQQYLARVEPLAIEGALASAVALVGVKVCAYNLLPFPPLNGGHAIFAIGKRFGLTAAAEQKLTNFCIWPVLFLYLAWLFAFGVFAWRQLT